MLLVQSSVQVRAWCWPGEGAPGLAGGWGPGQKGGMGPQDRILRGLCLGDGPGWVAAPGGTAPTGEWSFLRNAGSRRERPTCWTCVLTSCQALRAEDCPELICLFKLLAVIVTSPLPSSSTLQDRRSLVPSHNVFQARVLFSWGPQRPNATSAGVEVGEREKCAGMLCLPGCNAPSPLCLIQGYPSSPAQRVSGFSATTLGGKEPWAHLVLLEAWPLSGHLGPSSSSQPYLSASSVRVRRSQSVLRVHIPSPSLSSPL